MNAAAKELPVSYDLSKPQEDKESYVGSVLFFKHVIFTVTLLLILIPTTLSIYLFAQVRSLNRQLDTAGSQLAAMQEHALEILDENGAVQGKHTGYTVLTKHSVVLAQADPDGQALEQANARYAVLEAEHAALLFELLTDGGTENE